jgi:hypothetical protein
MQKTRIEGEEASRGEILWQCASKNANATWAPGGAALLHLEIVRFGVHPDTPKISKLLKSGKR